MDAKIFLSYAHVDMENRPGYTSSRAKDIIRHIMHELKCEDSKSPYKILRDVNGVLFAGDYIPSKLSSVMDTSDMALVLMSESYCRSDSCLWEFSQLVAKSIPLCIVEIEPCWKHIFEPNFLRPVPEEQSPLSELLIAPFWGTKDFKAQIFGTPLPTMAHGKNLDEYEDALTFTVGSIKNICAGVFKKKDVDPLEAIKNMPVQTVLIANPTGDVKNELNRLTQAITSKGYSVLVFDVNHFLANDADVSVAFERTIEKCNFMVQLLGSIPGRQIDPVGKKSVLLQHEMMKKSQKPFQVWESPIVNRDECDDEHKEFLQSIQPHRFGYEDFESYLLKQIEQHEKSLEIAEIWSDRAKLLKKDSTISPLVGIDFDQKDKEVADLVMTAMSEFVDVVPLDFDLAPKALEGAVLENEGIVLLYCKSREGRTRISAHFKIIQRFKNKNREVSFDVAIGNGQKGAVHPAGPSIHVIPIDVDRWVLDKAALAKFVDDIKVNAHRRYQ